MGTVTGDGGQVKALLFDVFGTVVDWRSGVIRDVTELARAKNAEVDAAAFADAWRADYGPVMDLVRRGELPWAKLDDLHRRSLDRLLGEFGFAGLDESEKEWLNRCWHRLDPWPDAVPGLNRLKRRFVVATFSNGNVSLLVDMAKRAGLPWDCVFSAELFRHYKPDPEFYLGAVELLGLTPPEVMLVAAHNNDLCAAAGQGLATAFVFRPGELGPGHQDNQAPARDYTCTPADFEDLAATLCGPADSTIRA
ncbi:MAG TPA: haloacid dehalogenase type II [Streptosporangiaceae bacterium]|jgi:2-haloacid dehalogenase|nr:haloacid dehalogenase type II [Streptosporangiaceae bacterium]